MDRADRQGLGVALAGHLALLAALVFGLFAPKPVPVQIADTMTVQLVPDVMMRSTARKVSREAPAPLKAEAAGKPEDAAPPPPSPKPEPPAPAKPAPPKPAPAKPSPPKPAPPKPVPAKPAPAPVPKSTPKPKPAPPKPKPTPVKPAPSRPTKPAPEKAAPAKPEKAAPAKTAKTAPAKADKPTKTAKSDEDFTLPSDLRGRRRPDEDERAAGTGKSGKAARRTGSLLGSDFSKDIAAAAREAKGSAAPAAQVGARAMAGLGAAIIAQVKPCYVRPSGGTDSQSISTVLGIRMNADGTVVSTTVTDHAGVNDANRAYVRQMDDAARRAVLRCAPLKLPAELYDNGWRDILITFRPESLGG